jgi:glycosyltransferase involved in cell wall biosynthesis
MHEQVARNFGGKVTFAQFVVAYGRAASEVVRRVQPHVIHAHWWLPGGLAGTWASRQARVPLVITTHGTDVEQLRRAAWAQPLAHFAFSQAQITTCGSTYLRERLVELRAVEAGRVKVIPMPVNPLFVEGERTREEGAARTGVRATDDPAGERAEDKPNESQEQRGTFRILTVARLTRQKSIDTLIEALALVRARGIDAQLRIVGDGDQRAALEEKTRALQLERAVQFLGMRAQSELPRLYSAGEVFVLPSLHEGMGLVLAEALLCGAPVIATASGGITDIVRDRETGLVFPERDPGALADALACYARAPQYAARLAAQGRRDVLARFTPRGVANEFFQVYEQAARS